MKTTMETHERMTVYGEERYRCPNCEVTSDAENWSSVNCYCPGEYDWSDVFFQVGDRDAIINKFRNSVPEDYKSQCPDCEQFCDDDDRGEEFEYSCPRGCGNVYDTPHTALLCCSDCDDDEYPCLCLAGLRSDGGSGVRVCECHDNCGVRVCTVCHSSGEYYEMNGHDCWSSSARAKQETPTCAMCASEYCCQVHSFHKSPHRACSGG